jgi:hypothetical protein
MKTGLREMFRLSPDSERFKPKLKVLKDNVEHHAVEEEEEEDDDEGKNVSQDLRPDRSY